MRGSGGALLALSIPCALSLSGCASALFAPCDGQVECQEGLRCVNLGGDTGGICTKPCTVQKARAGYPDPLAEDKFFEDGTTQEETVTAECSDGDVTVVSEDNPDTGAQNIGVSSANGVVGVCRVSAEQLASDEISGESVLSGFCAPL